MYNRMSDEDLIKACEGHDLHLVVELASRLEARADALDAAREDLEDRTRGAVPATPPSPRGVDRRRMIWLDFPSTYSINGELADQWVVGKEREHHAKFVQFSETVMGSTRAVFREPSWGACGVCPGTAPLLDGLCRACRGALDEA